MTAGWQSPTVITLQRRFNMKAFNTLAAATLVAASSLASAADLRDNVVISAGNYVELAVLAGVIAPDEMPVAEAPGTTKFTPQPWSVQRSMHMPQTIEFVGDEHGEPRGHL
jgi:hypothetical protein